MDTERQLYEQDATGWQRGLYRDIVETFRAPIVNWIFRTTMANEPEFLRYAWGQVKPTFETHAFAQFSANYRNTVLSELEAEFALPSYRRADVGVRPAEYRELRGQVETFDVVGPRLAVLFELMDRGLQGKPVGTNPDEREEATAPFPAWVDRDRGRAPTMIPADDVPADAREAVEGLRAFHGFGDGLPSIYRCLAQWPGYLDQVWADTRPLLESDAFERACAESEFLTEEFVTRVPYRPQLGPDSLREVGFSDESIRDVQDLFRTFNTGPVSTVLPALSLYAATLGVTGYRSVKGVGE